MTTLAPAPNDLAANVEAIAARNHPALWNARIVAVLASGPSDLAPATAKPMNATAKAAGASDAILILDQARYEDSSQAGRAALVDHALASLQPVTRKGVPVVDGDGRPRLRRRAFTVAGVGFPEVLRRHKARSVENSNLLSIRDATADATGEPKTRPKPNKPTRQRAEGATINPSNPTGPRAG